MIRLALEGQVRGIPDAPEVWVDLGNAYFDTDQPVKAIKAYKKAQELAPGNPDVLTDLGVMYRRSGHFDEALHVFDLAIAASARHQQARLNKGVVLLYDKKDQPGAIQVWEELLAIHPDTQIPSGQSLGDFMKVLK